MFRLSQRLTRSPGWNTRAVPLAAAIIAALLLAFSALQLTQFRDQRQQARQNRVLLAGWQEQLLTATPAAQTREQLRGQLGVAQARFAEASGLLPGTEIEVAVLQRISEAAERSGVALTTLQQVGEPFQDGALVGWQYDVAATGDLARLTDFTARLEQEAFPAAYFADDVVLTERENGDYVLAGTLTVFGSTLSTGTLDPATPAPGDLPERLRREAREALDLRDYELALSLLLQLAALEPGARDVNDQLYEAYVAYGNDLLSRNRPTLAEEQCEAALTIDPDGSEAVACLLAVAQLYTPTPSGTAVIATGGTPGSNVPPSAVPASATSAPPPPAPATATLRPTVPPPPTRTPAPPQPTSTPRPSDTPSPAVSATPSTTPPPTVTGTPPTATPTPPPTVTGTPPTATPTVPITPNPYPFGARSPFYLPNCGLTQIKGTIYDANNRPLNDVTVRVWFDGAAPDEFYSLPSGRDPTRGAGEWDVVLAPYPKEGQWYVQVVNRETGAPLSPRETVYTDTGPCQTGQTGHQVVIQDFVRFGEGPGVPGATSTATRVPSATVPPSNTPTVTNTPTISPTPTPTPVSYSKNEDPDLDIPDGPDGRVESTLVVPDSDETRIRELRVFLNIAHDDVSDLEVNFVHPDGTSVRLHSQGEDVGDETIRRWFNVTGSALASLRDKRINGTWTLEIIDRVEAETGKLLSWEFEVYP